MEDLTGVDIDNYVIVDFEGFEQVIDAMGKVRVDVGTGCSPRVGTWAKASSVSTGTRRSSTPATGAPRGQTSTG